MTRRQPGDGVRRLDDACAMAPGRPGFFKWIISTLLHLETCGSTHRKLRGALSAANSSRVVGRDGIPATSPDILNLVGSGVHKRWLIVPPSIGVAWASSAKPLGRRPELYRVKRPGAPLWPMNERPLRPCQSGDHQWLYHGQAVLKLSQGACELVTDLLALAGHVAGLRQTPVEP